MTPVERFYALLNEHTDIPRTIDSRLEFAARYRSQQAVEQVGYDSGGIPHPTQAQRLARLGWPSTIGTAELATWNYLFNDPVKTAADGLWASPDHRAVLVNPVWRYWGAGIYRTFKPGNDTTNPLLARWYFVIWLSTGVPPVKAIVANGTQFPDALSSSYLTAKYAAPLFLVTQNSVPAATRNALTALDPSEILLLGGTSIVDPSVEAALTSIAPVRRIGGADRYATAVAVSKA